MPIPVDIFSGFLGAGKTMLIKKLISEGVYERETAVIENEFGEVAIDGAFLSEKGLKIKEISQGCICCSVTGDFKKAILEVISNYKINRIIIEPSGVASLSDVLKVFKEADFKEKFVLDRVITVADATRFEMYKNNFSAFYKNQIENAKMIVLSRTQLFQKEKLEELVREIRCLNKRAPLVTTPWSELTARSIIKAAEENFEEELLRKVTESRRGIKKAVLQTKNAPAGEVFDSFGIEIPYIFSEEKLRKALICLQDKEKYGEVLRAKGILCTAREKWLQFDYVPGESEIRKSNPYYAGRLCVIGTKLNKAALSELFKG